ncbi:hypothetical protein GGF31_005471 [Allomyces arbusculus]|nr:hypothetical protein GGF31_005471 [Allomyces arbusculus]
MDQQAAAVAQEAPRGSLAAMCAAHPYPAAVLTSLSLTHVMYHVDDALIGKALALITLLPLAMVVSYATLAAARPREPLWLAMFLGQLGNEGLNFVLKRWIAEHRPTPFLGKGYGMPSSHAQFMSYWCIFVVLLAHAERRRIPSWLAPLIQLAALAIAALVIYSRVHLQYHTVVQVLAGTAIGAVVGGIWFAIVHPRFPLPPFRPRPSEQRVKQE